MLVRAEETILRTHFLFFSLYSQLSLIAFGAWLQFCFQSLLFLCDGGPSAKTCWRVCLILVPLSKGKGAERQRHPHTLAVGLVLWFSFFVFISFFLCVVSYLSIWSVKWGRTQEATHCVSLAFAGCHWSHGIYIASLTEEYGCVPLWL